MIVCKFLILFIVMETVTGGFVNIKTNCKTIQKLQRAWYLCPTTFRGCLEKLKHLTGREAKAVSKTCRICAARDICKNA
uniref:Saposin B-type domain-containing protein n=1 Tax=Glossina austeni TaxID=7395 RepID=A0A1A9UR81_GLOAU